MSRRQAQMVYCRTCGEPYPADMPECPRCAAAEKRQKDTIRWWLFLALLTVAVLVVWAALHAH